MQFVIKKAFRIILWFARHSLYRVRAFGTENIPERGGALLVCNQKSYLDFLFIIASTRRNIRFFVHRPLYEKPVLRFIFSQTHAIPISLDDAPEERERALASAREAIAEGHVVCLFLGLGLQRTHSMLPFTEGYDYLRQALDVPVIPVYVDKMWGGIFLYDKGEYFQRIPKKLPYPVNVLIGNPLPSSSPAHLVRTAVQELSATTFELRKEETRTLHDAFLYEAKKHPWRFCMADETGLRLSYGRALGYVLALCRIIRRELRGIKGRRSIGVFLPQSCLSALVNFAIMLAGHATVNIGVPISRQRMADIARECDLARIITTQEHLTKYGIDSNNAMIILDERVLFKRSSSALLMYVLALIKPIWALKILFALDGSRDLNAMASVLYSSGSTGEPKGVMLSHLNIVSNIEGLYQCLRVSGHDVVIGTLPFSHPFGFTASLCFPLVAGLGVVYHRDATRADEVGELVRTYAASVMIALPLSLSLYARRCSKEQFETLRYAIVGIDKLPKQVTLQCINAFDLVPFESYGATELSPIVSLGMPGYVADLDITRSAPDGQRLLAEHTDIKVGYPLSAVAVKAVDPHTFEAMPYGKNGLLLVKGPNVMLGYNNDRTKTATVIKDGWFLTGDIGFIDQNGFIHVIDRLSRFTRVGADQVSHAQIEEDLMDSLGSSQQVCAATSISDEHGKETLVVLYERDVNINKVLRDFHSHKVPRSWLPAEDFFYEVNKIPLLPNGKVDLLKVKELAKERHFVHHACKDVAEVEIMTEDNIQICLNHYRRGNNKVIIIAQGWRNSKDAYTFRLISGMFTKMFDVICFDFRGNGKSGGLFSWVSEEHIDLRAVIAYAVRNGYQRIGVIGFSLGGATAIIECSQNRNVHSVIAVSPPMDFWKIDYHFWEEDIAKDLKIIFGPKGEGRTIRSGNPFHAKIKPIDVVDKVSPIPLHIIHGDADWLIKPYHSKELYLKAKDPKRLTMLSGEGHADRIYDNNPKLFEQVCLEWFDETL